MRSRRRSTGSRTALAACVTAAAIGHHAAPATAGPIDGSARLELRIIAQSGYPSPGGGAPQGCVFDEPPGIVAISPGIARRFEVQARIVTINSSGEPLPHGLALATLRILSDRDALWGRALLSSLESSPAALVPPSGADCSGSPPAPSPTSRGVHARFRAWDAPGAPNDEDPRNGAFSPSGFTSIRCESFAPPPSFFRSGDWEDLYSFEFTLPIGQSGQVTLRAEPTVGPAFEFWTAPGGRTQTAAWTSEPITLRTPAATTACCRRGECYLALTPSACFASGGRASIESAACGPRSCCAADFSGDGLAGVQDVLDFVNAYIAGDPRADINASGTLSVQDIFDFLALYYGGCP